jgi:MFS transporter, DHA1 family, multidrug resistance protein
VLARAVMRDLFHGQELARNLALATAIFAIGPIVAPLVGAAIAEPFGWRAIFGALALFACGLLLVLLRMPETIPAKVAEAASPKVVARRAARLFAHPQSRYFLLLAPVAMSTMLFILASAPRIYDINFGLQGTAFALFFALHGTGIIIGQTANRRLIPKLGIVPAMLVGNCVLILAAVLILGFAAAGLINAYVMTALLILYATSYLVVYANATAMVLDPHGDIAGFAAALFGFTSQIGAAIIASVIVLFTGDSTVGFAVALLGICLVCFAMIANWLLADRRAERTTAGAPKSTS